MSGTTTDPGDGVTDRPFGLLREFYAHGDGGRRVLLRVARSNVEFETVGREGFPRRYLHGHVRLHTAEGDGVCRRGAGVYEVAATGEVLRCEPGEGI